jgi:hypothetical protein
MTNRTRVPQNIDESITLGVTAGPTLYPGGASCGEPGARSGRTPPDLRRRLVLWEAPQKDAR